MYCFYTANASWSMVDVINDIAALCSGTLVASLSASCNKALSYQTGSTISPGWTIYDADTAQTTKGVVLSCPDADNLTTKYWNLWGSGTTFNYRMVEDWNATANTTTNAATTRSPTYGTAGVAFSMHVFATPQYIMVCGTSDAFSMGTVEVARDTPYLTTASPQALVGIGIETGLFSALTNLHYLPRMKNPATGATLLTTSAGLIPFTMGTRFVTTTAGYMQSSSATPCFAADGSQFHPVQPLAWGWAGAAPSCHYFGRTVMNSGGHGPMFIRNSITGAVQGDIIVVDGQNYIIVSVGLGVIMPVM